MQSSTSYNELHFKKEDFSKQNIELTQFERCIFTKCDFTESIFNKVLFESCKFIDCNFSLVKFPESKILDGYFKDCKLVGIDWGILNTKMGLKIRCIRSDLSFSVFPKIDISGSKFRRCKMYEVTFAETTARKCDFRRSDFVRAVFQKTLLIESDFRHAKNYIFNPAENICTKAKFSFPEAINLLRTFGIRVTNYT
jgi:fluoroquinolone resistance protein